MYRLDVFRCGRWYKGIALGRSMKKLEEFGFTMLRPNGGSFEAFRVRRARKADMELFEKGCFRRDYVYDVYVW